MTCCDVGRSSWVTTTYGKANTKYMKIHNKTIELLHLMYLHANNLYGWKMLQKLPVDRFKWSNLNLMKSSVHKMMKIVIVIYDQDSNKGYILEVDVLHG